MSHARHAEGGTVAVSHAAALDGAVARKSLTSAHDGPFRRWRLLAVHRRPYDYAGRLGRGTDRPLRLKDSSEYGGPADG
jgi:hypothetical protein